MECSSLSETRWSVTASELLLTSCHLIFGLNPGTYTAATPITAQTCSDLLMEVKVQTTTQSVQRPVPANTLFCIDGISNLCSLGGLIHFPTEVPSVS